MEKSSRKGAKAQRKRRMIENDVAKVIVESFASFAPLREILIHDLLEVE